MSKDFKDDKSFLNIEIGAGCGNFGEVFHAKCYLTDKDEQDLKHCKSNSIHLFCSAHSLPWSDNRFDTVIMCNPYQYGFKDTDDSVPIFSEIARVLKNKGKLIVIGHSTNSWCAGEKIVRTINKYRKKNNNNVTAIFTMEDINSKSEYKGYVFRMMDGTETAPDKRYTVEITKEVIKKDVA